MTPIFIPTRGRIDRQITWDFLSKTPEVIDRLTLVVHESELLEHHKRGRKAIASPAQEHGVSAVFQWIQDTYGKKHKKIITMEDDVVIDKTISDLHPNMRRATPDQVKECFDQIDTVLDHYPSVGLCMRQYHQKLGEQGGEGLGKVVSVDGIKVTLNTRQLWLHAMRPDVLLKHNIRYDAVKLMQDFHVTLSLLERGISNAIFLNYALNESANVIKAPSGCEIDRNKERQGEAALLLSKLHPGCVTVHHRQSPSRQGSRQDRIDVTIAWRKAFEVGKLKANRLF